MNPLQVPPDGGKQVNIFGKAMLNRAGIALNKVNGLAAQILFCKSG